MPLSKRTNTLFSGNHQPCCAEALGTPVDYTHKVMIQNMFLQFMREWSELGTRVFFFSLEK